MADEDRKFRLNADVLGGVLFTLSSFPLVLVAMDLFREPGSGGAAAAARTLVDVLGHAAPILWAGGFAVIGTLMVLGKERLDVLKSLGGVSGAAVGLAILLGGVTPDAGGSFGRATGGAIAGRLTEPVAIFFGVVCVLAPIWFAWLRGMISENSGITGPQSAVLPEEQDGGVSTEEAALLVPSESSLEYLEEAWREVRQAERPPTLAPSPYPEDPRLAGEVPDGAAPIEAKDAQERGNRPATAQASHWKRPKGDLGAGVTAREDLAAEESAPERAARSGEEQHAPQPAPELTDPVEAIEKRLEALQPVPAVEPVPDIEPVRVRETAAEAPVETEIESAEVEAPQASAPAVIDPPASTPAPAGGGAEPLPIRSSGPPVPSWEQSALFEAQAEAASGDVDLQDEPLHVGAEQPEGAVEEAEARVEVEAAAEEEVTEEVPSEVEEPAAPRADLDEEEAPESDVEEPQAALDEEEADEEEVDEEEEADEEGELDDEEADVDEELEEEDEEGEDEEYEYEDEEGDEDEYEEGEDEEDEEYEEELGDDEEYDEEGDEELEEYEEGDEAEDAEEEEEDVDEQGADEDEEEAEEETAELEEEAEPEEEEVESEDGEEGSQEVAEAPEPEVVLQPQAAPDDAKIPSHPAVAEGGLDPQLLYDAGLHFLQEGRVAVSMLQRKFGLDFDQACELLDALQGRGLIGPYLGGQRRDILMSLEEWEETLTST